jgi:hypothetical protein
VRARLRFFLLGLAAFLIALLVVFPASWAKGLLPPQITCGGIAGSIWRGQCNALAFSVPGQPTLRLDSFDWQVHPLALLRARMQADFAATGNDVAAHGAITASSGGYIEVTGLSGSIGLDHSRLAALPAGWSARADASNLSLGFSGGKITALGGVLLARQLRDARGTGFGDFRLEFPRQEAAPFRGTLTDSAGPGGGPMQLRSQLVLNADQSWQLRGTVVLRPGSPQGLAAALDQLAPADLNGVRNFSLEGTAN